MDGTRRIIFSNIFKINLTKARTPDIIVTLHRDVAQFGSAHVWGAWSRKFKSCHPDQKKE